LNLPPALRTHKRSLLIWFIAASTSLGLKFLLPSTYTIHEELWIPATDLLQNPQKTTKENRYCSAETLLAAIQKNKQALPVQASRPYHSLLLYLRTAPTQSDALTQLEQKLAAQRGTQPIPTFTRAFPLIQTKPKQTTLLFCTLPLVIALAMTYTSLIKNALLLPSALTGIISTLLLSTPSTTKTQINLNIENPHSNYKQYTYSYIFTINIIKSAIGEMLSRNLSSQSYPTHFQIEDAGKDILSNTPKTNNLPIYTTAPISKIQEEFTKVQNAFFDSVNPSKQSSR
jgi:hypothetical protein